MKKITKLLIMIMAVALLCSNTLIASAYDYEYSYNDELKTVTVKSQKEFVKQSKDSEVGHIWIKPSKKTTIDFNDIDTDACIHIYMKNVTIKNIDKRKGLNCIFLYPETAEELKKAVKLEGVTFIEVNTKEKEKFLIDNETNALIIANTPNSNWVINKKVNGMVFENLKNGTITDNIGTEMRIEGTVKEITIGNKALFSRLRLMQEKPSKVKIEVKGILDGIEFLSDTPVEFTFSENTKTKYVDIQNDTFNEVSITVNGKTKKVNAGIMDTKGNIDVK